MSLDWASRVAALNAFTLAGADATNRDSMVARLDSAGGAYDAARTALGPSAVDAAKAAGDTAFASATSAWITSTQAGHERADACGRFVIGSGSPTAFAPDGSAEGPLLDRLAQAAQTESQLKSEVANHTRATITAYAARPTVASYYGPPYQGSPRAELGLRAPGLRHYYFDLFNFEGVVLQPLLDEADALVAELAFT